MPIAHRPSPIACRIAGSVAAIIAFTARPIAAQAPDSAVVLDSVVVQALRLPTSIAEAPFAITVLGPETTRRARSGDGLAEVLRGVPGVQVSDRESDALGDRIVIRGAGARAGFGVRGVRVVIDGVPATLPDGQTDLSRLDLATVGRIEVLRGPASALYGNASGGVLRISSAPPPAAPFAPAAELLAGSNGLLRVHARIAGAPGSAWYSITATHRESDGYRDHSASTKTFVHAAGGVLLAGGGLTLRLDANHYDALNPGSLNTALLAEDPSQAYPSNVTLQTGEEARQLLGSAMWAGAAGPGALEVAAYASARELDNPIPPAIIALDRTLAGARVLYRIQAAAALTAGAEIDYQRDDRANFENQAGEPGATTLDQLERVRALGVFAHLRLPLGSPIDASAALRYDRFRFAVDDRLTAGDPDDSGARTMSALSPSLGLHARLSRAIDLFANVATAFETPTTTELANRPDGAGGFNPELEPQRTVSFEAGARGRTAALSWALTGWTARTEHALIPFEVPSAPGRQYFRNAGSTESHGIEAALGARVAFDIEVDLAYAWIDAQFDEFTVGGTSYAGNDVPGIAPHRIEAAISRRTQAWMLTLEATHSAAIPVNDANTAEAEDWTTISIRGGFRLLTIGRADAWLFGDIDNVGNAAYVGSVVVNQGAGRWFEPASERTFYVGIRAGPAAVPGNLEAPR